jgi:hypothetical protein
MLANISPSLVFTALAANTIISGVPFILVPSDANSPTNVAAAVPFAVEAFPSLANPENNL